MAVQYGLALGAALSSIGSGNLSSPRIALQESKGHAYWAVHVAAGRSLPILGTEDLRNNVVVGVQYLKPEAHLRIGRRRGEMLQEVYYEHSGSKGGGGFNGSFPTQYDAGGYLLGGRYTWGFPHELKVYGDLGLGLIYVDRRTEDVPSRLNSTPFVDFGLILPGRPNPVTLGLRLFHISNAGLVAHNGGQNQLLLDLGIQF